MTERRKYTRKQKLAAVLASDIGTMTQTSEQTGIPLSTIKYWVDQPEFAAFRSKAREDLADEVMVVAHLAWKRVAQAIIAGDMEPRDALFAADKASTLAQLLTGAATARVEVNDIATLDDHETQTLRDWLDGLKADVPVEVAE